jgi:hypothetical protein
MACAWIQPESDHAIGVLNLARALSPGVVIAYSARPMIDSIGAHAAGILGVNVKTMGSIGGTAA